MAVLLLLLGVNLLLAVAPVAIALPFQAQTPWMLWLSFTAKSVGPGVGLASLAAASWILWRHWQRWGRRGRFAAGAAVLLIGGALVLARTNFVEIRFAAAPGVALAPIGAFRDISENDMVIGVVIEGISRAYPVRYLAYHHLVNDRIGSTVLLPNY